ncbi:deoxyribodipyrimidine photo-lyase [bacterium]|nr:deoxyribodipyrimidine photo-lyase [candidate division CSSED10-310 bacterium]
MVDFRLSLFLFRRDLRLADNTGLMEAHARSGRVLPCFILDDRQLGPANRYRGDNAVSFMARCLIELDGELRARGGYLHLFAGTAETVLERLLRELPVDAVFCNRDYTPFSQARDMAMDAICRKFNRRFLQFDDALLQPPGSITTGTGSPYTVYTQFFKRARVVPVPRPRSTTLSAFHDERIAGERPAGDLAGLAALSNCRLFRTGGRREALEILDDPARFTSYEKERDVPARQATTGLSAHLKFGAVSAREVYHAAASALGYDNALIGELYWRDFFTQVGFHFPRVFHGAFKEAFGNVRWNHDEDAFTAWCQGRTGFPIVDAGMRQLRQTGFMHNRARMITASFLVKDLHIDWRLGERHFARHLIDYDPAVNNGNWQWSASTGCDAQPYFRIFNPWRQQRRFDPECEYIHRWVPELDGVEPEAIHGLERMVRNGVAASRCIPTDYPPPMVNHALERRVAKERFATARQRHEQGRKGGG